MCAYSHRFLEEKKRSLDCHILGCVVFILLFAAILLDGSNKNSSEKDVVWYKTSKGFSFIDTIKKDLEEACPGIVSREDVLVISTRDGIVLVGIYSLFAS